MDRRSDAQILGRRNWVQRRPRTWLDVASWLILLSGLALIAPAVLGCRWVYTASLPVLLAVTLWATLSRHYLPKIKLLYLVYVLVGIFATLDVMVYGF